MDIRLTFNWIRSKIKKNNIINININNHFPTPIKHRKLDKENIIKEVVDDRCNDRQRKLDKIFTSKVTGIPIMFLLLAMVLYITIIGANYPSDFLSYIFAKGGEYLYEFCIDNIKLSLAALTGHVNISNLAGFAVIQETL